MNELEAITNEFRRYRTLGEKAFLRLDEDALNHVPGAEMNSVAMLVRHLSGNFTSRFTNFLTEDGEKPWRERDAEFREMRYSPDEIERRWRDGWKVLEDALERLAERDLDAVVRIRGVELSVHEALARSLSHAAYHVGQIVFLARFLSAPGEWESLSIPRGGSVVYNADPLREKKP